MRSRFDMQLAELNREMIGMGMLCETAIAKASKALLSCDISMAKELPELLAQINRKERESRGSACGSCCTSSRWLRICAPSPPP